MGTSSKPLLLLDFDGVVCNSVPEQYRCARAVLERVGIVPNSFQSYRHMSRFIPWFLQHEGMPLGPEEISNIYWETYNPDVCLIMPGVLDVLNVLVRSMELVIVSSAASSYITNRVEALGLSCLFAEIYSGHDKKVDTIRDVCYRFGAQPSETFLVGDMGSDVDCAEQAGVGSILLSDHESPHISRATHHITDIRQLLDILK